MLASAPVLAQETGVETVVVTGSRIPRPEADQPNPVVSLSADDILHSGTTNLGDYLRRIPALTGSLGDFETSGYNTGVSSDGSSLGGLNLLDLRNLGYVRTLVLIDGHRVIGQSAGSTAVDIDSIPVSLVDRVEVVTGGSSAVYGADGVSGVVNFVMKHDLEGIQGRAQYGSSQDGGGTKYFADVSVGHNFDDDKGNVTLTLEHSHQDSLYFTQRKFTKVGGIAYFVPNPANPDGSNPHLPANIPTKDAQFVYSAPTGAIDIDLDGLPDHLGNGNVFNLGTDIGGGSAIGSSGMPYATDLQGDFMPVENRNIAEAQGHYDFKPWFKLSGTFSYAHVDTASRSTAPFDDDITISADNAFLPPSLATLIAGNGYGLAALSEDYLELRNKERVSRNTYRFVGDVSGDVPAQGFLQNVKYDVSYVYGQTDVDDVNLHNRNIDRFAAALDSVIDPSTGNPVCRSNLNPAAVPTDLSWYYGPGNSYFSDTSSAFDSSQFGSTFTPGPNSGCVPFNPFDPTANNKASIAWMTKNTHTKAFLSQEVWNGFVSADIGQFKDWGMAGPLSLVIGGEYRTEKSKSNPDPETEIPGLYWFGGTSAVMGSFNVSEAFGEASLPVLADKPFAKELTFDVAGRLSHYSTAGDNQSWKLDALYSPFSGIRFRGTSAVAVRAPNIGELFAPDQNLYAFVEDPCDKAYVHQGTQYRIANCQAIENALLGPGHYTAGVTNVQTDQTTPNLVGGNPALKPEVARTLTLGVVLQPDFFENFTATLDWYRVKIADAIEAPSAQDIANECVDLSTIANPYCTAVTRTNHGNFPGSISLVTSKQINVAQFFTQGEDFTIDYHMDLDDMFDAHYGSLDFHLIGNHLDAISTTPLPSEAPIKSANTLYGGVDFGATPNWQFNLDMVWHLDKWTVDYNIDWYDGVLQIDRQTVKSEPNYAAKKYLHLDPRDVHSVQVSYDVSQGWNVYAGVDNLFYQKPSIGQSGYPVEPLGRFFYGGVNVNLDPGL
ncbi:MAG TPA: TonB-dependent receptor [Rhizomicrobium sp.]|nr:TonB-dependent receptor [Rhizomicrobium sp.]